MVTEQLYKDYQLHLLNGKSAECRTIVKDLLSQGIEMKTLYIELFQRSLYEVGYLWETNKVSVAVEHLCTSITESLINLAYPYLFASEHNGKKAVITCTPGEYHQVGARMVADYFELNGWDGYFLGANTPENELIKYITEVKPDIVAISMSVSFNLSTLIQMVEKIRFQFPDLSIFVGGQGFRWGGVEAFNHLSNVYVIHSLNDLDILVFNI